MYLYIFLNLKKFGVFWSIFSLFIVVEVLFDNLKSFGVILVMVVICLISIG